MYCADRPQRLRLFSLYTKSLMKGFFERINRKKLFFFFSQDEKLPRESFDPEQKFRLPSRNKKNRFVKSLIF